MSFLSAAVPCHLFATAAPPSAGSVSSSLPSYAARTLSATSLGLSLFNMDVVVRSRAALASEEDDAAAMVVPGVK